MNIFSSHLQLSISSISQRCQNSRAFLFFQKLLQLSFHIQWNDNHASTQTAQAYPLPAASSQILKNRYCSNFRDQFFLGTYTGKTFFLDIIAQNQQTK